MESKELRVGNLVKLKKWECPAFITITGIVLDDIYSDYVRDEIPISDLAPIEITPKWLVRMGFIEMKLMDCVGFKQGGISVLMWDSGTFSIEGVNTYNAVPLKYIHQLQNLYFALTGTELKFSEK